MMDGSLSTAAEGSGSDMDTSPSPADAPSPEAVLRQLQQLQNAQRSLQQLLQSGQATLLSFFQQPRAAYLALSKEVARCGWAESHYKLGSKTKGGPRKPPKSHTLVLGQDNCNNSDSLPKSTEKKKIVKVPNNSRGANIEAKLAWSLDNHRIFAVLLTRTDIEEYDVPKWTELQLLTHNTKRLLWSCVVDADPRNPRRLHFGGVDIHTEAFDDLVRVIHSQPNLVTPWTQVRPAIPAEATAFAQQHLKLLEYAKVHGHVNILVVRFGDYANFSGAVETLAASDIFAVKSRNMTRYSHLLRNNQRADSASVPVDTFYAVSSPNFGVSDQARPVRFFVANYDISIEDHWNEADELLRRMEKGVAVPELASVNDYVTLDNDVPDVTRKMHGVLVVREKDPAREDKLPPALRTMTNPTTTPPTTSSTSATNNRNHNDDPPVLPLAFLVDSFSSSQPPKAFVKDSTKNAAGGCDDETDSTKIASALILFLSTVNSPTGNFSILLNKAVRKLEWLYEQQAPQ